MLLLLKCSLTASLLFLRFLWHIDYIGFSDHFWLGITTTLKNLPKGFFMAEWKNCGLILIEAHRTDFSFADINSKSTSYRNLSKISCDYQNQVLSLQTVDEVVNNFNMTLDHPQASTWHLPVHIFQGMSFSFYLVFPARFPFNRLKSQKTLYHILQGQGEMKKRCSHIMQVFYS